MLIDDVKIKILAGHGGHGVVAFNKNKMSLGPTGTSGGRGGSIYCEGVSDLSALNQFRFKKEFKAENGEIARGQFRDGHDGADLVLKFPIGTVIYNLTEGKDAEIKKVGERIILAKGGTGGRGNFHFRSSTNTSPKQSEPGTPGENFDLRLELKLIADIGFVGLPNAGKSSLLNELTKAQSKVGNYPFTTLEPNLGTYYELILADIPGLIEGSSGGKGLGIKFLRHIERTKILFHFISAESSSPDKDYKTIRKELGSYSKALLEKPEHIFLTKSDLLDKKGLKEKLGALKKIHPHTKREKKVGERSGSRSGVGVNPQPIAISIYDLDSINKVEKILNGIKNKK